MNEILTRKKFYNTLDRVNKKCKKLNIVNINATYFSNKLQTKQQILKNLNIIDNIIDNIAKIDFSKIKKIKSSSIKI